MPKGKKKGKYEHRRTEQAYSSDEDAGIDMTIDNCSETSAQSDLKSNHDDAGNPWDSEISEQSVTCSESKALRLQQRAMKWKQLNKCLEEVRFDCNNIVEAEEAKPVLPGKEPNIIYLEKKRYNCKKIVKAEETPVLPVFQQTAIEEAEQWKHRDIYWEGPRFVCKKNVKVDGAKPVEVEPECEETAIEEPEKKNEIQEKFEEKVLEIIESLSARSNAARAGAFVSLRAALQRRALDGLLSAHRATLADHVARSLRRGKDAERKAAAAVAPLLALQIGEEGTDEFVREVRPALAATATDKSASLDTRTECCSSLAVLCYLMEDDLSEILEVMRMFETIFSGSYLKGDGSVKVSGAAVEEGLWHAAALDGWALLLPLLAPAHALSLLNNQPPSFARLGDLLEAVSLEVRMAAGGALAAAHETAAEEGGAALAAAVDALLPRLSELARDSHKYRAKRDRKLQRATFRDILKYFEEGEVPCMSVRVGAETVTWATWGGGAAYAALAAALGGALQALAPRSERLRTALQLGDAPPLDSAPQHKLNKLQRHLQNNAACKARTVARNKNRDKRSAALAI